MEGLDFLITAIGFSVLGYVLCYMTLSVNRKSKTQNANSEKPLQTRERTVQHRHSA
ncbi:hypothetical protein JCM17380_08630 [Desulfosporosinus burensis]